MFGIINKSATEFAAQTIDGGRHRHRPMGRVRKDRASIIADIVSGVTKLASTEVARPAENFRD